MKAAPRYVDFPMSQLTTSKEDVAIFHQDKRRGVLITTKPMTNRETALLEKPTIWPYIPLLQLTLVSYIAVTNLEALVPTMSAT